MIQPKTGVAYQVRIQQGGRGRHRCAAAPSAPRVGARSQLRAAPQPAAPGKRARARARAAGVAGGAHRPDGRKAADHHSRGGPRSSNICQPGHVGLCLAQHENAMNMCRAVANSSGWALGRADPAAGRQPPAPDSARRAAPLHAMGAHGRPHPCRPPASCAAAPPIPAPSPPRSAPPPLAPPPPPTHGTTGGTEAAAAGLDAGGRAAGGGL